MGTTNGTCIMCAANRHPGNLMHNELCECPCRHWPVGWVQGVPWPDRAAVTIPADGPVRPADATKPQEAPPTTNAT